MCWDEHHDDADALMKLVFWNPDRGDKQNMTGYDTKRLDGRNKKITVQYCCTYIRVHRCSSPSTYPRTPPGELWGGIYKRISRISCSNEIMNWWNLFERSELTVYSTAVRIYEYTAAAVPVRTQGNGTPPGELWGGIYIRIFRITWSNEIMNWLNSFERSEFPIDTPKKKIRPSVCVFD